MTSHISVFTLPMGLVLICALVTPASATGAQEPTPSFAQRSPFETVPEPLRSRPAKASGPAIVAVEFRGAARQPQSALRVLIASRAGGPCDPETLRRDALALNSTGRFSDVGWEIEESRSGPIVRFVVVERPVIQAIEFRGSDAVTLPEILERFAQQKVNLRVETLLQETELARAAATVRALVAERGRRQIAVSPYVEPIWPASGVQKWPPAAVKIIFRAEEQLLP
ncbi:hypothetical protein [Paludibaculum fermentans]|uniref:hypothetical protein n=1 Tax=Paludibaculum fermentans TaxID=1473598 RepID=UPI003EBCA54B